jgi:hypothetical protein
MNLDTALRSASVTLDIEEETICTAYARGEAVTTGPHTRVVVSFANGLLIAEEFDDGESRGLFTAECEVQ